MCKVLVVVKAGACLSHKSDSRGEIAPWRDAKDLSQLNHYALVLQSPKPITLHQEAFLPESLRAYGRPLYKLKVFY